MTHTATGSGTGQKPGTAKTAHGRYPSTQQQPRNTERKRAAADSDADNDNGNQDQDHDDFAILDRHDTAADANRATQSQSAAPLPSAGSAATAVIDDDDGTPQMGAGSSFSHVLH